MSLKKIFVLFWIVFPWNFSYGEVDNKYFYETIKWDLNCWLVTAITVLYNLDSFREKFLEMKFKEGEKYNNENKFFYLLKKTFEGIKEKSEKGEIYEAKELEDFLYNGDCFDKNFFNKRRKPCNAAFFMETFLSELSVHDDDSPDIKRFKRELSSLFFIYFCGFQDGRFMHDMYDQEKCPVDINGDFTAKSLEKCIEDEDWRFKDYKIYRLGKYLYLQIEGKESSSGETIREKVGFDFELDIGSMCHKDDGNNVYSLKCIGFLVGNPGSSAAWKCMCKQADGKWYLYHENSSNEDKKNERGYAGVDEEECKKIVNGDVIFCVYERVGKNGIKNKNKNKNKNKDRKVGRKGDGGNVDKSCGRWKGKNDGNGVDEERGCCKCCKCCS